MKFFSGSELEKALSNGSQGRHGPPTHRRYHWKIVTTETVEVVMLTKTSIWRDLKSLNVKRAFMVATMLSEQQCPRKIHNWTETCHQNGNCEHVLHTSGMVKKILIWMILIQSPSNWDNDDNELRSQVKEEIKLEDFARWNLLNFHFFSSAVSNHGFINIWISLWSLDKPCSNMFI